MTRARVNLLLDALMVVLMAAIAGLGFLTRWVLLPGFARRDVYGPGVELEWLGLDRHEWGDVHLVLGITLLVLLVLHVVLHWSQVVGIWRVMVRSSPVRVVLAVALLVLVVALLAFPALVTPEVVEGGHGEGGRGRRGSEHYQIGNQESDLGSVGTPSDEPDGIGRGRGGSGRGLGRGGGGRGGR